MYTDLIIGFDGSAPGRDALAFGRHLAAVTGARPTVVCAHPFLALSTDGAEEERLNESLRSDSDRTLDAARAELADVPGAVFRGVADASPARALHRAAEDADAALIVLGSTHRTRTGRVMLGTTADQILHAAPCAVAVAPTGYAEHRAGMLGVVGAGIDAGDDTERVARVAARIARGAGATLRLVTVVDTHFTEGPLYAGGLGYRSLRDAMRTTATATLERAAAAVTPTIPPETTVREGAAADELIAESSRLDLLVLGSRGFGPLRRIVLGSVSTKVLRAAGCPVLVLPRHSAEQLDDAVVSLAEAAAR